MFYRLKKFDPKINAQRCNVCLRSIFWKKIAQRQLLIPLALPNPTR